MVVSFAAGSLVLRAGGRTRVDARRPRSSGAFLGGDRSDYLLWGGAVIIVLVVILLLYGWPGGETPPAQ